MAAALASPVAVLVVASATDCSHCVKMAEWWPMARAKLEAVGIRVVDIKFPSRNSPLDTTRYPKGLRMYIPHFPALSIFRAADYDTAAANPQKDIKLDGRIYGGYIDASGFHDDSSSGGGFNADTVTKWATGVADANGWRSTFATSTAIKPLVTTGNGSVLTGMSGSQIVPNFGNASGNKCSGGLNIVQRKW